jgi:hypothetical protein
MANRRKPECVELVQRNSRRAILLPLLPLFAQYQPASIVLNIHYLLWLSIL